MADNTQPTPTPVGTPSYVQGSATDNLPPDLSILTPNAPKSQPTPTTGAGTNPTPPSASAGVNPNADSDYVATQQHRSDVQQAQQFINQVEGAANPGERAQMLLSNGVTEEDYVRLKQITTPFTNRGPVTGAAIAQQVEGKGGGQSVEMPALNEPEVQAALAGPGLAAGALRETATGLLTFPMWNQEAQNVHDWVSREFPNHPHVVQAVDALFPAVATATGLGIGAMANRSGASASEPAATSTAPAAESAPAGTAEPVTATPEAPVEREIERVNSIDGVTVGPKQSMTFNNELEARLNHLNAREQPGYLGSEMVSNKDGTHTVTVWGKPRTEGPAPAPLLEQGGGAPPNEPPTGTAVGPASQPEPLNPEVVNPKSAGEVPHTMAEMAAQAKATPFQPEDVRAMELTPHGEEGHALLKQPIDAMDMLRLHFYTADQVNAALDAARDARNLAEPGATERFLELNKELAEVTIPRWKAGLHQAGLTLRVLGDPASAESGTIRAYNDAMDKLKNGPQRIGAGPSLDEITQGIQSSSAPMDGLIKAMASLPDAAEREALLARASKVDWTVKGAIQNLYVNSILSFNSVAKKATSDVANIVWQVPARALAEAGSRVAESVTGNDYGSMGVSPGETVALTRGLVTHIGDSLRVGLKSFVKNQPMFANDGVGFLDNKFGPSLLTGSGFENSKVGQALDLYGHLVSLPGRSMIAMDQFSKSMQYNMELYALAARQGYQQAAGEGLVGAEASARAAEVMEQNIADPLPFQQQKAMNAAKENTFTADLEGFFKKVDAARSHNFVSRTLFPFFKTPVNITLQGIRQSPLALASPTWWGTVLGGGPDAAVQLAKTALGSTVIGYLASNVLEGKITGGAPDNLDKDGRQLWLRDHEPYSVKVGTNADGSTKWLSHTGLEPLSWLIGATADMVPAFAYLNQGDAQRAATTLALAFSKQIDHQPMWGALHTLMEAVDSSDKDAGGRLAQFVGQSVGGFIPSTLANIGGAVDPVKRQTLSFLDELKQRIPWLKRNGVATLDPWGDPVIVPPGFMENEFSSFKVTTHGKDPESDEIVRLHQATRFSPPGIPTSIGGANDVDAASNPPEMLYGASLSAEEQNRWKQLRGNPAPGAVPKLKDAAATLMRTDNYQSASDPMRANMMTELFKTYGMAAKGRLLAESPEIQLRIASAYKRKAEAMASKQPSLGAVQ